MNRVRILDCTLRDGGYINDCNFGRDNINSIIRGLEVANIDIIECGYLRDGQFDDNQSEFSSVEQFAARIRKNRKKSEYVLMGIYGEYEFDRLPDYQPDFPDGIRVTFHKEERYRALDELSVIKEKGYNLYIQPTCTMGYSDAEILEVIDWVNRIKPYAFYIVDTFGEMREYDVTRLAQMIDNNLDKDIRLGFHSHNNLQLSYSNSVTFLQSVINRELLIDASVYGMGRGAGNLCSELITEYLNVRQGTQYITRPMLELIDSILSVIRDKEYWGYSPEYYLSAVNRCHPSYARFFADKNTLQFKDMQMLLNSVDLSCRADFHKAYAEELYLEFQKHQVDDTVSLAHLREMFEDKPVLLIGSGRSAAECRDVIQQYAQSGIPTVSVNHADKDCPTNYTFLSNNRRLDAVGMTDMTTKLICTSNVECDKPDALVVDFGKWIYRQNGVTSDNALLILLNLLTFVRVSHIYLAGFDGYTTDISKNYYDETLQHVLSYHTAATLNELITYNIEKYRQQTEIEFITPSIYEKKTG